MSDSAAPSTSSTSSRKRTRDQVSNFVRECRWYVDHYSVESALSDRLESLTHLKRIVDAELDLLTTEQRDTQSAKAQTLAAAAGDDAKLAELGRQQVAEAADRFGLRPWLERMAGICPAAVQTMERLLGADVEVFRVTSAECKSQMDYDYYENTTIQLTVTVPDSLLASHSPSLSSAAPSTAGEQSSFVLETNVGLTVRRKEYDRSLELRIPHSSLTLSAHGRQQVGPVWEQRIARRQHELEQQRAERQQRYGRTGLPSSAWPDFYGSEAKFESSVVSVGVLCCDLEVLYLIAALLGFRRLPQADLPAASSSSAFSSSASSPSPSATTASASSAPPAPAVGARLTHEQWPFVLSAAELLFLVLHLAVPAYLDRVGTDPRAGDLSNQRDHIAEAWMYAISSGAHKGWGGGRADCMLGGDYAEEFAPRDGKGQEVQIPGEEMRESSFMKQPRWFRD